MSRLRAQKGRISVTEYLEGEQLSEIRHEFIDGQVYAMGGASDRHGLIVMATVLALGKRSRERQCQLFIADMKVRLKISGQDIFYYPDLLLSCDPTDRESYFRQAPCMIIEVLSESTERIDRREKMLAYQALPSLQEYVLVAQDYRQVEIYRRRNEWQPEIVNEGPFHLDCLDLIVAIDEVYEDVTV
ncbi:MAG: Uma2 family endonuclease [Desulfobulbaceae bacterium]|nr:Uma2 family endonuclease [Desulfobulbaceae bacterium]